MSDKYSIFLFVVKNLHPSKEKVMLNISICEPNIHNNTNFLVYWCDAFKISLDLDIKIQHLLLN